MGDKSPFLRAVALLAQIGSLVPANAFSLALTDVINISIGARDNLAEGASLFMVEVPEAARILYAATPRSLGRTSTRDGAAIARAMLNLFVRENTFRPVGICKDQGQGDVLMKATWWLIRSATQQVTWT
ncbi:hypothetical protein K4K48_004192 [Colletotrichum sp. SAR 10_66]|nr:hypothetical protein K4K48_004192 [Colletotrichum sp. SAR 10_66]